MTNCLNCRFNTLYVRKQTVLTGRPGGDDVMACNLKSICCLSSLVNLAQFILQNNMCLLLLLKKKSGIEKLCNIIGEDRMAAKHQGLMTNFFSNQSSEYIFQQILKWDLTLKTFSREATLYFRLLFCFVIFMLLYCLKTYTKICISIKPL